MQPARASGILRFDVGIAGTAVAIDTDDPYWRHAVREKDDFTHNGYAGVPRLVVAKGFGAFTLSGSYAKFNDSGIATYGGALDVPILRGSIVMPEIALRGAYATITGLDTYELKTYGVEAFVSKGFGPVTPYAAYGRQRLDARGAATSLGPTVAPLPDFQSKTDIDRFTVGVRVSLLVPKLSVEATQGEVRSYAAKISLGF